MTERDLLEGNRDLIQAAIEMLRATPAHFLEVAATKGGLLAVAKGCDWVQVTAGAKPGGTYACDPAGKALIPLPIARLDDPELELVAYRAGQPVARVRQELV